MWIIPVVILITCNNIRTLLPLVSIFRRAQFVGVSDPDAEVRGRGLHHGVPLHVPAARRPHAPPRDDPRTVLRPHPHQAIQEPLPGEFGIKKMWNDVSSVSNFIVDIMMNVAWKVLEATSQLRAWFTISHKIRQTDKSRSAYLMISNFWLMS